MGNLNLSEAAKEVLLGEDSKSTFDANIAAKRSMRGQDAHTKGEVGDDKLPTSVAYGQKDAGLVGQSPEMQDDHLPDYLKGTPTATPPGATPPVGSEKDGVGYTTLKGQPQETMGRADLRMTTQSSATDYENIRDRVAGKMPTQTMMKNPGATFQSYGEDINALMQGENLSEEFVSKATMIFEAAVIARAEEVIAEAENQLIEQFEVAVEEVKQELAEKVDAYLDYMASEWMAENEVAIESGLRAEITEEFLTGLHNLFVENYIEVPEDKVDVVEELAAKVAELEASLNEEINTNVSLKQELNEQKKIEAIYTACEGLTQTQVEKLKGLAESIEFTTEDEFVSKVETLKESYFKVNYANSNTLNEEVIIEDEPSKVSSSFDPSINVYAKTISKTLNK
jgi:methyltransferase-like protein